MSELKQVTPTHVALMLFFGVLIAAFFFIQTPSINDTGTAIQSTATASLANLLNSKISEDQAPIARTIIAELFYDSGDDFERGISTDRFFIRDFIRDEVLELNFQDKKDIPPGLVTGSVLKIKGVQRGSTFDAAAGDESAIEVISVPTEAAPSQDRVLTILGNFSDKPLRCSADQVTNIMYNNSNSADKFFLAASQNRYGLTGDVIGPFDIGFSSSGSDYYGWARALETKAQEAGYVLADYDKRSFVLELNGTGYGGVANIGGPRSWIFQCSRTIVYTHELGHNIRLSHASQGTSEYGDRSDVMDNSYKLLNAPHLDQVQWLTDSQIIEVSSSGTYTLASLYNTETTSQPIVLKIPKPDTNEFYYISYRRAEGLFDSGLGSAYANRINIHRYRGSGYSNTHFLSGLLDGSSFSDSLNGFTITQLSSTPFEATVSIETICALNAPTVSISPSSGSAQAGITSSYNMTITNRDSEYCGNASFTLSSSEPNEWTATLASSNVTLSPMQSIIIPYALTSDTTSADGSYQFKLSAQHDSDTSSVSSQNGTYIVDTSPPSQPTGATYEKKGKRTRISWEASIDNDIVSKYLVFRDGGQIGETTSTSFQDRGRTKEGVAFTIQAVDRAENLSPMSGPAINIGSSDGTGSGKPVKCTPWPACNKK